MASQSGADLIAKAEDLDINEKGRPMPVQGGRGRARGGHGGRAGGGGAEIREVAVSKALSKLLRHAAKDEGITLDAEGFARLDQVMNWQRLKSLQATFADIRTAVDDNAKQRFSMKPNASLPIPPSPKSENPSDWVIRANQGHSIAIESSSLLTPITLESGNIPSVVVHGTYYAFYQPIVQSGGLKKGARNHIHFSTGLPEDKRGVISGMRSDTEMLIYVDIKKSLKDGYIKWWLSENGVVLTEGDENGILGTKYFKKVAGRRSDCGVLWEDGEEIAELPLALRNRKAPQGKGPKGARGGEKGKPRGGGPSKGKDVKKSLDDLGGDEVLDVNKP